MMRLFWSRQFLAFLLTGGIAALVNFFSRIVYSQWMGFSSAVIAAYLSGMVTAFILARLLVFQGSTQTLQSCFLPSSTCSPSYKPGRSACGCCTRFCQHWLSRISHLKLHTPVVLSCPFLPVTLVTSSGLLKADKAV